MSSTSHPHSFDAGRSVGEREGSTPMYGSPTEAYRLSGDVGQYMAARQLARPDDGRRNAPIKGSATLERLGDTQGARIAAGEDVVMGPSHRQVQGRVAVQIAQNLSMPQAAHSLIRRQRGMPGKVDAPDGTPRSSGRVKAIHTFSYGLGAAVDRPADAGHDPGTDELAVDYLHNTAGPRPGVLDKYVDAARLLPQPTGPGSGYPRDHERSNHDVVGRAILASIQEWSR